MKISEMIREAKAAKPFKGTGLAGTPPPLQIRQSAKELSWEKQIEKVAKKLFRHDFLEMETKGWGNNCVAINYECEHLQEDASVGAHGPKALAKYLKDFKKEEKRVLPAFKPFGKAWLNQGDGHFLYILVCKK